MNAIRFFTIVLILKAQTCCCQLVNSDSLLINYKKAIEIQQSEHIDVFAMDDETRIAYYLLVSRSAVTDLIQYTNDSNPLVRSSVFAGLLRREISKDSVLKILESHKNDTAKFTSVGADVHIEWTVKEFMEAAWQLKLSNKLPDIDYKKAIERLRSQPLIKLNISGFSHGLIDKNELLNIDSLSVSDKEFRVISFSLFVGEKEMKSLNSLITNEMKQMVERAEPGYHIVFDNIKVVTKDNMIRRFPSLTLRLK